MRGASPGDGTPWRTPDEQSEQVCQFTGSNQGSPMKLSACFQPVHYKCRAQPLKSQAAERHWCITAGLPSARMVKGESPGRLAENWPPREVIRKHRLKKPIPTTKILQERETDKRAICDIRPKAKDRAQETERSRRQRTGGVMSQRKCSRVQFKLRTLNTSWHFGPIFQNSFCLSQAKTFFWGGHCVLLCHFKLTMTCMGLLHHTALSEQKSKTKAFCYRQMAACGREARHF